jgi:hypothetical protein
VAPSATKPRKTTSRKRRAPARLFSSNPTQNPRPRPHEKSVAQPRRIRDPTTTRALLTAVSKKSRIVKLVKYGYVRVSWSVSPQELRLSDAGCVDTMFCQAQPGSYAIRVTETSRPIPVRKTFAAKARPNGDSGTSPHISRPRQVVWFGRQIFR